MRLTRFAIRRTSGSRRRTASSRASASVAIASLERCGQKPGKAARVLLRDALREHDRTVASQRRRVAAERGRQDRGEQQRLELRANHG